MTTVEAARLDVVHTDRSRADQGVRSAATGLLVGALALVTAWWIQDGGVVTTMVGGAVYTSIGQLTGLIASVLLLAQVVLMARIPVLEHAWGQDELARIHRLVGFTSFNLMLVHIGAITLGYAVGRLSQTPATLWDLTLNYPGMLLAVAGTVALVMVVVTSLKAARRRLRYESWHLLHLYAYLGAGLALPHQLWTGQQFIEHPVRTAWWWAMWGLSAAAIVIWRLGVPIFRSLRHDLRVSAVVREAPGVVSVYVSGRSLDRLPVHAGQFLTWRFLAGPGWSRAHPYSLSAAPNARGLRITVKDLGDGSRDIARLRPGTRALVEGPYGRLTARVRSRRKVALIGAGVGITPLRALAEGLTYRPGDAVLVQRCADQPLFARELEVLSVQRGLEVVEVRGHRGDHGTAPAYLVAHVPDLAEREVYVCGPEAWAADIRRVSLRVGLPARHLHIETFRW
ncbi:ferric reductase-like transmembrane domain-containing protein [Nocardioides sp.]|uniref:ferredoxin reductase family protein n=1 Tax=Nocardioides sp. TaxID=35761 RepID=UPI0035619C69